MKAQFRGTRTWARLGSATSSRKQGWLAVVAYLGLGAGMLGFVLLVLAPNDLAQDLDLWRSRLSVMADDRKDAIDMWLGERVDHARAAAVRATLLALASRAPANQDKAAERDACALATRSLSEVVYTYRYLAAYLVDASGNPLAASDGANALDPKDQVLGREAAARDTTPLDLYRHGDSPVVVVAAPVLDPERADAPAIGAVVLVADPALWLYPLLDRVRQQSPSGEVLLVRAQGSDTLSLSPLRFRSDPPLTFHRPQSLQGLAATSALKGHEAFAQYDDYRGVPVIAVTRRLDRAPWGLVVKVDKAEALSNHRVWVRQVHTIVGLLWLMVGTVGVALGRVVRAADLRALAASERRLRRFYESGLLGVMYWDMRGHISDANDKFLEMIGYTREDLAGGQIDWVNLTPPEFRYLDDASVAELMATGVNERPLEKEYVRKDGSRLPILIASAMLDDARINGVAFVLDITRRRRAEQEVACLNKDLERRVIARTAELDAANRELEAFSYSVSHDLRAPLRAIDGFSRMLLEDHASSLNSEGRRLLGVVREQTMRMAQLIDDLLAFSRIDRRPLNRVVVDMTALAQSTFAELTTQAERECIAFAVHPMPPALGEPAMVRQLWANLLANAVKFTSGKPQRRIEVGASADGSGPVYWVKDNGAGFDMRYKDKLFGVFQRLHSSTEFPGTGVGLALVKRIVERHGGTVWAEGAPGEGASFFWTLPAQEETP